MTYSKAALSLILALSCAPRKGEASPLLGPDLQALTVFSETYTTAGANSKVFGNVLSGGVSSTGANADIFGDLVSVGAATTGGAGSTVSGTIVSGGVLTTGAGSTIGGDITSSGASTVGANSRVGGDMVSGGAATTGASSTVIGSVRSGGAASTGASSSVDGAVAAAGAISIGAGSTVASQQTLTSAPIDATALSAAVNATVTADQQQVIAAQTALTKMVAAITLDATITTNLTLESGVYSAASLSTTAGTILTLDGQNRADQYWVFNIADILATGASTDIVMINAGPNSGVIWNIGNGYATLGANSTFLGTILADQYISVGANTDVFGAGTSCGGLFSATSYVSTGDTSSIGGAGCSGVGDGFSVSQDGAASYAASVAAAPADEAAIAEPASLTLLLTGLLLTASLAQRRTSVRTIRLVTILNHIK